MTAGSGDAHRRNGPGWASFCKALDQNRRNQDLSLAGVGLASIGADAEASGCLPDAAPPFFGELETGLLNFAGKAGILDGVDVGLALEPGPAFPALSFEMAIMWARTRFLTDASFSSCSRSSRACEPQSARPKRGVNGTQTRRVGETSSLPDIQCMS